MAEPVTFDELWRVTIVPDRYGGIYSGGRWLAFPTLPDQVPDGPFDGDVVACGYWADNDEPVGRGGTPDEAYADLVARLDPG